MYVWLKKIVYCYILESTTMTDLTRFFGNGYRYMVFLSLENETIVGHTSRTSDILSVLLPRYFDQIWVVPVTYV